MRTTTLLGMTFAGLLVSGTLAHAACPDDCVPGGGRAKTDCLVEYQGVAPATPGAKRLVCEDGDPACDTDGSANGSCRFLVRACFNVVDPALPTCVPSDVATFELRNPAPGKKGHDPQLAALAAATPALPTGEAVCSAQVPVYVTLGGQKRFKARTRKLRSLARASDGRKDPDKLAFTCKPSPRFPRPDAGYATARVITEPAELIDGPLARGRIGDVLLANDRIQVVIQQPGRVMFGIGPYGGTIIDADRQRVAGEERDSFEEMTPLVNVENTVNYTSVTVLNDGSDGGAAVVRATGVDDLLDYVNPSTIVSDAGFVFPPSLDDRDLPLEVQTDYVLEPGATSVRIETTLRNTAAEPFDTYVGDIMNGSGQVELFQDTYGFGEPLVTLPCAPGTHAPCAAGTCDPCNVIAWSGDESAAGVSYGYIHTMPGSTSFSVSGVTASLLGNQVLLVLIGAASPNVHFEAAGSPGDAVTLTRWFTVGEGSVADVTTERNAIQEVVTGTLEGVVTEAGEPAVNADVAVLDESGPLTRVVTHFRTDAAGRFSGTLAPGTYDVRVQRDGRLFPTPEVQTVVIEPGVVASIEAELPPPGTLDVRVIDPAGNPIPAKVTLVGFDPSPELVRVESIAGGAVRNETRLFGDQGDSLAYGLAGVFFADRYGTIGPVAIEPGRYQVVVSRGTRWSHFTQTIDVPEDGSPVVVNATLAPVSPTPGFVTADFHLHALDSPDSEVSREARVESQLAEGMDFITPSEHDIRVDFAPIVAALGVTDLIATAPGVEITTFDYGHFNSWPVTVDPLAVNGGAVDWGRPGVPPGMDYPSRGSFNYSPAELLAAALADPRPNLVQINHIDSFFGPGGLDIDTGMVPPQSFKAPETRRLDPSITNLFDDGFQALEVWNGNQGIFLGQNLGDWINLLNQGIRRTAVATSDTHEKRSNSGGSRTLIASEVTQPAELWDEAETLAARIAQGRAIGTNGPFVAVRLDAASTGQTASLSLEHPLLVTTTDGSVDLTVDVQSPKWAEFDTIEVYVNAVPEPYDHDDDPATRDRYRVTPSVVLTEGVDFTRTLEPAVPGVPNSEHWTASASLTLLDRPADTWVVVIVRGTPGVSRPFFPIVPGLNAAQNPTFEDLIDGNLGEGGNLALAFTNPLFVDVDGDGQWTP
ncbi:MAG TPA: CehA/McbA family metallohydrolase [Candidatus Limnocylindria bacterium]|nr:CehA/McbA family metallohydrolase [Candidatus Limnocylindria bacterium]